MQHSDKHRWHRNARTDDNHPQRARMQRGLVHTPHRQRPRAQQRQHAAKAQATHQKVHQILGGGQAPQVQATGLFAAHIGHFDRQAGQKQRRDQPSPQSQRLTAEEQRRQRHKQHRIDGVQQVLVARGRTLVQSIAIQVKVQAVDACDGRKQQQTQRRDQRHQKRCFCVKQQRCHCGLLLPAESAAIIGFRFGSSG